MPFTRRPLLLLAGAIILVLAAVMQAKRTTAAMLDQPIAFAPQIAAGHQSIPAESLMRFGSPTHGYKRSNGIRRSRTVGSAAALHQANVL